jgi:hypothetical protein
MSSAHVAMLSCDVITCRESNTVRRTYVVLTFPWGWISLDNRTKKPVHGDSQSERISPDQYFMGIDMKRSPHRPSLSTFSLRRTQPSRFVGFFFKTGAKGRPDTGISSRAWFSMQFVGGSPRHAHDPTSQPSPI